MYLGFLDPDPQASGSVPFAAAEGWNQSGNHPPSHPETGVKESDVHVLRLTLVSAGWTDRSPVLDWVPLEADSETRTECKPFLREAMAGHPSRGVGSEAGKGGRRKMQLYQATMGKMELCSTGDLRDLRRPWTSVLLPTGEGAGALTHQLQGAGCSPRETLLAFGSGAPEDLGSAPTSDDRDVVAQKERASPRCRQS